MSTYPSRLGPQAAQPPRPPEFGLDLLHALGLLRRRLGLALAIAALVVVAAVVVIGHLPKLYTAEALVVLNARASKAAELQSPTESLLSRTQADLSAVRTEVEILTSSGLLRAVTERLDVLHHPAFREDADDAGPGPLARWRDAMLGLAARLGGGGDGAAAPEATDDPVDRAVERLGRMVEVGNEGGSYALRIRAETRDPVFSAQVANTLAEVYLEDQRAQQAETLKMTSAWLAERLGELRSAVLAGDEGVERYRARNQLGQADLPSLLDSEITQLNSALIEANTRLSRAQANLSEAEAVTRRGGDLASAGSVLASLTIQTLREQEGVILVRHSALLQELGPRHPQAAEVGAQLEAVRTKIKLEVERIVGGMRSDLNAIKGDVQNLQRQLSVLKEKRSQQADAQAKLADLEREARAARDVYAQFLERFNTTLAQQTGQQPDARLVAAARPPLDPSAPRRKLLLGGAVVGASALGAFLALLIGLLRGGFGGPGPLEEATGLATLGLVPELGRRELAGLAAPGGLPDSAAPIRALAFAIDARLGPAGTGGRVLLVTSSVVGEGASTLALTMARAFAAEGRRTLLVDLDARESPPPGRSTRRLTVAPSGRAITGGLAVSSDPASGLDVVAPGTSAPGAERRAFASRIVGALDELRREYELVLLDAPPVLAVPEVLPAAGRADGVLLVVRFEGPGAATVRSTVRALAAAGANVLGTALSRVDPRGYRRYGQGVMAYATRRG